MKTKIQLLLLLFLTTVVSLGGYAQRTKKTVEADIKKLQKEIELANSLLKETSQSKEVTLHQVELLEQNIQNREKLIAAYNEQIKLLDEKIKKGENNILKLNGELQKLREEYATMVQFAYRNRSQYDRLEFLFASEDFNQALRRLRYIQQFTDARKTKMEQIANTQKKVGEELESQRKDREEQAKLLADEKQQQSELLKEKEQLNAKLAELKKKEKTIQKQIQEKEARAKAFQEEIERIIEAEIRKANEKKNPGSGNTEIGLTPYEIALSTNFGNNKGKLPWPVERGFISSTFGTHTSRISNKVTITNKGVDITTTANAKARAVFNGEVVWITQPNAADQGVIIKHGEYFTVYSHLDEVYVKCGDKVTTKQEIGKVHTDRTEQKTELHFELHQGKKALDPALWLAKITH